MRAELLLHELNVRTQGRVPAVPWTWRALVSMSITGWSRRSCARADVDHAVPHPVQVLLSTTRPFRACLADHTICPLVHCEQSLCRHVIGSLHGRNYAYQRCQGTFRYAQQAGHTGLHFRLAASYRSKSLDNAWQTALVPAYFVAAGAF